jgi:Uma2 family endonuclease
MAPAPNWQHQRLGGKFVQAFLNTLDKKENTCQYDVLYETDWLVTEATVVRPDVMIVCEPIQSNFVTIPPSLILEILSASTALKDRNTKINLYKAYNVRYYLIADAGKKSVEIFQ